MVLNIESQILNFVAEWLSSTEFIYEILPDELHGSSITIWKSDNHIRRAATIIYLNDDYFDKHQVRIIPRGLSRAEVVRYGLRAEKRNIRDPNFFDWIEETLNHLLALLAQHPIAEVRYE